MKPKISFPRLYFFIVESIQDFTFLYLNSPEGFFSFKLKIHASWNFFKVILVLPVLKSPSVATGDIEWKMLRIGLFLVFSKCIFHVQCEPDVCFEFSIRTVYCKESILKWFKTTKVLIQLQVEPLSATQVKDRTSRPYYELGISRARTLYNLDGRSYTYWNHGFYQNIL